MDGSTVWIDPSADRTADREGDIQSPHRAPPQHNFEVNEELMVWGKKWIKPAEPNAEDSCGHEQKQFLGQAPEQELYQEQSEGRIWGRTPPMRLLKIKDRTEKRFEAINRNRILPGTNFQGEKLILGTDNSAGSMVQLS